MRPVLEPRQMQALEKEAFGKGLSPLLLMEDAAREMHRQISMKLPGGVRSAAVFCGRGNNGGDGLALARLFQKDGLQVTVFMPSPPNTPQAEENFRTAEALGIPFMRTLPDAFPFDFALDAFFGTGFHGAPQAPYDAWILRMNRTRVPLVFSVDIPSGLDGKTGTAARGADGVPLCVRADWTLSLGFPKTGVLLGPDRSFCGRVIHCPIQLPDVMPETRLFEMEPEDVSFLLPERKADMHKGNAGRVLLYAGSPGMAGAAGMAALAALRAGCGLLTIACEEELIPVLQAMVPNAMCMPIRRAAENPPPHDVLAAGCGLGTGEQAKEYLVRLLAKEKGPAVLDADALNLLARDGFSLPENTLLTPHVGEAARLLGTDTAAVLSDLTGSAHAIAEKYRAAVLLKSSVSVITDGTVTYVNHQAAPALAKGGSGDALCGIAAALLAERAAQGFSLAAAQTGAVASLLLSMCGQRAEKTLGARSALTGEVTAFLPEILSQG